MLRKPATMLKYGRSMMAVPGMLMMLLFLGRLLGLLQQRRRLSPQANATFIWVVGFLIVSLVEMTLYASGTATITFFAVVGLAIGEPVPVLGPSGGAEDGPPSVAVHHESRVMPGRVRG